MIKRVAHLADQIGGPDQGAFAVGGLVHGGLRDWKSGHFDQVCDALLVDKFRFCIALTRINLAAVDVIGRQKSIRCAPWRRDRLAVLIDHKGIFRVLFADPADIADVVHQKGDGEVQPVFRFQCFRQQSPPDDLLTAERHHHGMVDVMIERIGIADAFKHQPRRSAEIAGKFGPAVAEIQTIGSRQFLAQRIGDKCNWVQHGGLPVCCTIGFSIA